MVERELAFRRIQGANGCGVTECSNILSHNCQCMDDYEAHIRAEWELVLAAEDRKVCPKCGGTHIQDDGISTCDGPPRPSRPLAHEPYA